MILAMTERDVSFGLYACSAVGRPRERTVKSDDREDEDQRQNEDDDRIDLETRRLVGVEPYMMLSASFSHFG